MSTMLSIGSYCARFFGFAACMGLLVMLLHCVYIGQCVLLSPLRRPRPEPDEEAAPAVPAEWRSLLSRPPSRISIASTRSMLTQALASSLPQPSTFSTHYHSAKRLGLPSKLNVDLKIIDHIVLLDACDDCTPCLTTTHLSPLYAFPNTHYVGMPGFCYAKKRAWENAVRWVKNDAKYVSVRFWMWDGKEMKARIGLSEDGSIEAVGLEEVLRTMVKGKSRA